MNRTIWHSKFAKLMPLLRSIAVDSTPPNSYLSIQMIYFDKIKASLEYKIVGLKPPSVHKMKTTKLSCNTGKKKSLNFLLCQRMSRVVDFRHSVYLDRKVLATL